MDCFSYLCFFLWQVVEEINANPSQSVCPTTRSQSSHSWNVVQGVTREETLCHWCLEEWQFSLYSYLSLWGFTVHTWFVGLDTVNWNSNQMQYKVNFNIKFISFDSDQRKWAEYVTASSLQHLNNFSGNVCIFQKYCRKFLLWSKFIHCVLEIHKNLLANNLKYAIMHQISGRLILCVYLMWLTSA